MRSINKPRRERSGCDIRFSASMTCHSERQSKIAIVYCCQGSLVDTFVREFATTDYEHRTRTTPMLSALSLRTTFMQSSVTYPVFGPQPSHWYALPGLPKWLSNRDAHQQA